MGGSSGDIVFLSMLVIAGAASERFKVGLFGDSHVSSSAFVIMVAALTGGARDATIVAAVLGVATNLGGTTPAYKTAFNVATYVLSGLAFVMTFDALMSHGAFSNPPYYGVIPATITALADFIVNALLVGGAIALSSHRRVASVAREKYAWLVPHYLPLGALLFVASVGYQSNGVGIVPVLAAPIAGIQCAQLLYSSLKRASEARIEDVEARIQAVQAELARSQSLLSGRPGGAAA